MSTTEELVANIRSDCDALEMIAVQLSEGEERVARKVIKTARRYAELLKALDD